MTLPADENLAEAYRQWDEFLTAWPVERLSTMTLPEYSTAGDQDCLTYWIESRLEGLGSIWGGSAFKFGIYGRKNQEAAEDGRGRTYGDDYAWYSKYGNSAETVFERVRRNVAEVARAAHAGDLERIDHIDFGPTVKWKLAFLYQNRDAPLIVPVYSMASLRAALGDDAKRLPQSALYRQLAERRGQRDVFVFGREVWEKAQARLHADRLSIDDAYDYLVERYGQFREPTQKKAGFESSSGRQLALDRTGKTVRLYLEPGDWKLPGVSLRREYAPHESRSNNLAAQAPAVATGRPAHLVEVGSMAALERLCDAYDGSAAPSTSAVSVEHKVMHHPVQPLNQILYGPPGTGKTYHTVTKALAILDPDYLRAHADDRSALKERFDELSEQGRVRFVTFHQSFSYEDFVEGIRAVPPEEDDESPETGIAYQVEKGIFAKLCEDAQRNKAYEARVGVRENPRVWKISIEEASSSGQTRQYCLEHGEARIGWDQVGDIRSADLKDPAYELSSSAQSSLTNFAFKIVPGDVLVCLGSRTEICAVGVVTGEYQHTEQVPVGVRPDYVHKLPVNWLATGFKFDITSLNQGVALTLKTVYPLTRISWPALQEALHREGVVLAEEEAAAPAATEPHVLIIDEINRGNISRIFGELITLIEPSKRAGGDEALTVQLPYSKKPFSVPDNVYIIGTMNTADRSLAGLDIALRRRFVFEEMAPDPTMLSEVRVEGVDIEQVLRAMNQRIEVLLNRDHCIGHSYFLTLRQDPSLPRLADIFRRQVLPLLQEYFFEDWERISWVLNDHRKSKPEYRFLIQPDYDLNDLFGTNPSVPTELRQWRIQDSAMHRVESYREIVTPTSAGVTA